MKFEGLINIKAFIHRWAKLSKLWNIKYDVSTFYWTCELKANKKCKQEKISDSICD